MKKELTAFLLATALALSATACNTKQANSDHHTTPVQPTESTTEPPSPETMLTNDQVFGIAREHWKATVQSDPKSYTYSLSLDEAKNVFVVVLNKRTTLAEEPFAPIVDAIWVDCLTGEIRMPDETVLQTTVTEEQAVELARNFWSNFLEDTETEYIVVPVANNRWDKSVHVIMLKHLVYLDGEPSHYSTVDELWVDRVTGEVRYPSSPAPDSPYYIDYAPPITETGDFTSYEGIIKLYRNVVHDFARTQYGEEKESVLAAALGITDEREKEWLRAISESGFLFYDGRGEGGMPHYKLTCGYAIKDLNSDGIDELVLLNDSYMIVAIFSMVDGKPILLDNYIPRGSCWIGGDGLLHVDGSGGADISSHTVYRISEGGGSLETIIKYGLNGHEWIGDIAVTKYYRVVDGEEVAITKEECRELDAQYGKYLGVYEGASATKEYSGLQFTPLFTEAEIAQQTYDGVLCNQIKVYDDLRGRSEYLKDCTTPYMQIPLYKIKDSLRYAYQDLDGDGIDELILDCGDTLILRYYKGTVFLYDFTFRNLYCLNTDGSYCWNHTGQSFEYGMKQLYFEGSELKSKILYRVVDNIAFYIGEACVSEKALQDYIDANPKKEVTFTPLTIAAEWDTLPPPSFGK